MKTSKTILKLDAVRERFFKGGNIAETIDSEISKFFFFFFPKKLPKVAMISFYYPDSEGKTRSGVAIYTNFISRELASLGCEVHVFTSTEKKSKTNTEKIGKGKLVVHRISVFSKTREKDPIVNSRMKYLNFDNKIPKELSKENKRGQFNLVNTNGWLTGGTFVAKQFFGVKWIHTFHAVEISRENMMSEEEKKYLPVYEWIERTIKHADMFIAVSEYVKDEIRRLYKIPAKKIFVIPNGIDPKLFRVIKQVSLRKKYGFTNDHQIIMFVGRFSKEKGISTLINAIPKVMKEIKNSAFLIVSPMIKDFEKLDTFRELNDKLNKLIKKYGKRIKVFSEKLPQNTLSNLYNMADLYVQPSLYEAFGITVLEAMACGKSIIASDCGGLSEIVFNGYNGLLCTPGDHQKLANDIIKLLNSPELKRKMEKNALQFSKKYHWNDIGKRTLDLYMKFY